MFWKKKEIKINAPSTKKSEIIILLSNGDKVAFHTKSWAPEKRITPWKDFYKWYFGRNSEEYIFRYDIGERMIRRKDIMGFIVHIVER